MRVERMAVLMAVALASCSLPGSNDTANSCPPTDDAGIFAGTLYTLDDAGDLTVDFDAGNGGIDLGPVNLPDGGGIGHVYEWPCVETYDCQKQRDASITFVSQNGVSGWKPLVMDYGDGADCTPPPAAAPDAGSCCTSCGANAQPCGNTCISIYQQCTIPPGCACP